MNDASELTKRRLFTPLADQNCANCYFSRRDASRPDEVYHCLRYPPTPMAHPPRKNVMGRIEFPVKGEFPVMLRNGWCGEWQPEVKGTS